MNQVHSNVLHHFWINSSSREGICFGRVDLIYFSLFPSLLETTAKQSWCVLFNCYSFAELVGRLSFYWQKLLPSGFGAHISHYFPSHRDLMFDFFHCSEIIFLSFSPGTVATCIHSHGYWGKCPVTDLPKCYRFIITSYQSSFLLMQQKKQHKAAESFWRIWRSLC